MRQRSNKWLQLVSEIQALAQAGLTYSEGPFDQQRYQQLLRIASELASHCTEKSSEDIHSIFALETGYQTPKIDIRAVILKDDRILLVRERSDGRWTLPGGWADVNESPSEAVIREVKEETGYDASAIKLLAFWDKQKHQHPPEWPHAYKCIFHCNILSGSPKESIEISAIDFFSLEKLPALSTPRVTEAQLHRLKALVDHPEETQFD